MVSPRLLFEFSLTCYSRLGRRRLEVLQSHEKLQRRTENQALWMLVDLLWRSGLVEEPLEIACNLPTDPGFVAWGTLLAACRNHANVKIAEIVAKQLVELNPEHGSPYVLLSNLYAKVGRRGDFRRTRKMMEGRGVAKVPGFSWIEVNGGVNEFVARDRFHVKRRERFIAFWMGRV